MCRWRAMDLMWSALRRPSAICAMSVSCARPAINVALDRSIRRADPIERIAHGLLLGIGRAQAIGDIENLFDGQVLPGRSQVRSEEHTSDVLSLIRHPYAVCFLTK